MIKYRVKGNFLSENGQEQNICSEYFENEEDPFSAREDAFRYFKSFVDLLINDFHIDFDATFKKEAIIHLERESFPTVIHFGFDLEFKIDGDDTDYAIDYFGWLYDEKYDFISLGLETEFSYYKENGLRYENVQTITYCDKGEWTEGFRENEPSTFKSLQTSLDFSDKKKPYWWLSITEKKAIVERYNQFTSLKNALGTGENSFVEFKPTLLYNFKTEQASIGVKNIIAKVICSFLNSNGGKLFIGVNDKGEVQGLDFDFSIKTKENEFDFFRNEFDNLLFQFFDRTVYNYIKADFNTDFEKPIFIVSVKPSEEPIFLIDKRQNNKEFYIRTITSSVQIKDVEEIVNYCLTHWKKDNNK